MFGRLLSDWFGAQRHIRTKFDDDPFANTFVRCSSCGSWINAAFGNSCCPDCGADLVGDEDTQRGIYPPGWSEDD